MPKSSIFGHINFYLILTFYVYQWRTSFGQLEPKLNNDFKKIANYFILHLMFEHPVYVQTDQFDIELKYMDIRHISSFCKGKEWIKILFKLRCHLNKNYKLVSKDKCYNLDNFVKHISWHFIYDWYCDLILLVGTNFLQFKVDCVVDIILWQIFLKNAKFKLYLYGDALKYLILWNRKVLILELLQFAKRKCWAGRCTVLKSALYI